MPFHFSERPTCQSYGPRTLSRTASILNLVMNAIEAMSIVDGRARELVITTRNVDDGHVQATVDDSGVGLDPGAIRRIFEPFYTTKSGGMGMGLSICRSIIENHGGRIWVSQASHRGTIFHFELPIQTTTH